MTEWQRNSPWRQGHLLDSDVATNLGFLHPDEPDRTLVFVISQDCDIAQDQALSQRLKL